MPIIDKAAKVLGRPPFAPVPPDPIILATRELAFDEAIRAARKKGQD